MVLPVDLLKSMYYYLVLTRTLENRIEKICQSQNPNDPLIIGKGYLSTGQEAVSVGAALTLRESDWLAPGHRDMGAHLIKGVTPKQVFEQYFCRSNSLTQGRDANVHFGCTQKRIVGFISQMGASACIANGLAAAMKYRGDPSFVLTSFGDGASSQGVVHESLNYAAVFKLPVVFLINNNQWAISTPAHEQYAVQNLSDRAKGYGMLGITVDGNDVHAVYEKALEARDHALAGKGPVLLECKTMRMCGHGTHDSAGYVPDAMYDFWEKRDPIQLIKNRLLENYLWNDAEEAALLQKVDHIIEQAWQEAAQQHLPTADELLKGVYTEEVLDDRNELRGRDSQRSRISHGGR